MTSPILASTSYYMRPLPSTCIAFNSVEGKRIFAQALKENHLESYFLLAGQFLGQDEPAFCALATLCMVLNAYQVDPQRVFKGVWRFYDQSMLSCCRPLDDIAQVGLTLSEFACLARCNGLTAVVETPRLDSEYSRANGIAKFRQDLLRAARGEVTMALSYSRKTLGQTGDGHFSCIGAYSVKDDKILCLDVARFKYPSYWIDVELAYDSMLPLDKETGQPRGYALLSPMQDCEHAAASLTTLTLNKSSWSVLSSDLTRALLATPNTATPSSVLATLANLLAARPTPPIAPRKPPSPSLAQSLYPALESTSLSEILVVSRTHDTTATASSSSESRSQDPVPRSATEVDQLMPLLLLTLLSPKSALTSLVPPAVQPELRAILDEALEVAVPTSVPGPGPGLNEGTQPQQNDSEGGGPGQARLQGPDPDPLDQVQLVKSEVELLVRQLGALGECCRAEEEGAACGCAGPGKLELAQAG